MILFAVYFSLKKLSKILTFELNPNKIKIKESVAILSFELRMTHIKLIAQSNDKYKEMISKMLAIGGARNKHKSSSSILFWNKTNLSLNRLFSAL